MGTLLGVDSALLPFACAVVQHLGRSARDQAERDAIVQRVAEVLDGFSEMEDAALIQLLGSSPALLASLFQNADLLPASAPETDRIARLVLGAIESLDRLGGSVPESPQSRG